MFLDAAPLEDWLRDYYFTAAVDISSSGVQPYALGEVCDMVGLDLRELAGVSLRDSRSAGAEQLRALIAARAEVEDSSRVLVANGSTEAQLLVLAAILEPGDHVVVVEPTYHTLISTARSLGCDISRWRLRPEDGFRPDLDDLRRLVSNRTRMIVVNFPHNPTGVTLNRGEQEELVEIADRHGSYLLWDGAFEDLVFDGTPLPTVARRYARGLGFGTMSKSFGLPGLRVGWGIVPPDVVQRAVKVRDYTTLALSPIIEFIACGVLEYPQRLVAPRLASARTNRRIVSEWLKDHSDLARCDLPSAGVVVFPALCPVEDTVAFCHRLMTEYGVLLVPGECFGFPGYVRLGFGGLEEDLRRGLDVLSEAMGANI